jgi:hypothetical protein
MASYQRIVSITDFKVTKLKDNFVKDKKDGKTVNAVFMLKAYYVAPEKLQPAPAPQQPAPAAGQPAVNTTVNPSAATTSAAANAAAQAGANAAVTNATAAAK